MNELLRKLLRYWASRRFTRAWSSTDNEPWTRANLVSSGQVHLSQRAGDILCRAEGSAGRKGFL